MKTSQLEENEDKLITELIQLAFEYLSVKSPMDDRPILTSDIFFVLPSLKKCISLYAAIVDDVGKKRLLSATILSRTLIEVIVTLLYVSNVEKTDGFYKKFMEHGRLRVRRSGKGWEKVTIATQISWVEQNYGITNLQAAYDNCSKLVHFSDSAAQLILDRRKMSSDGALGIVISKNEEQFPQEDFDEIIKTCKGMLSILRAYMRAAVKGKRLKASIITDVEPDVS